MFILQLSPHFITECALQSIIKEALAGYSMRDVILDAEMVAYCDERHAIDGILLPYDWHLRNP
jgi:hypothetical protein